MTKAKSEASRNTDIVIERIRSELVAKLSELAREVQRGNKAEADVALLEEQVLWLLVVLLLFLLLLLLLLLSS